MRKSGGSFAWFAALGLPLDRWKAGEWDEMKTNE